MTDAADQFRGDPRDLEQFLRLAASNIRSDAREEALREWELYKQARQRVTAGKKGRGFRKGDYIRSLTARAIDLRGLHLSDVCIGYADLRGVQLDESVFTSKRGWIALKGAKLVNASLRNIAWQSARLMDADLRGADLAGADLRGADLTCASLSGAMLQGADLRGADLSYANLVRADLTGANLTGSRVYGVAAWDVATDGIEENARDLIVTPSGEPNVTIDSIELAQFVYLLQKNPKIRDMINTVGRKAVLILGRFTPERKAILDGLRADLRQRGYLPMVFDFDRPNDRDLTETIRVLAGLSSFIIADITNPKSSPLELQAVVPDYRVPLVPIIASGEQPFAMFRDLWNAYSWVLDPLEYESFGSLSSALEKAIIAPALEKRAELAAAKARELRVRKVSDYT